MLDITAGGQKWRGASSPGKPLQQYRYGINSLRDFASNNMRKRTIRSLAEVYQVATTNPWSDTAITFNASENLNSEQLEHQPHWSLGSILIDLDAQCSSSLIQVFHWKTLFKQPYMLSRNSTSFLINNMLTTYTHQKFYSAPTHFFGNTSFS